MTISKTRSDGVAAVALTDSRLAAGEKPGAVIIDGVQRHLMPVHRRFQSQFNFAPGTRRGLRQR